MKPASKVFMIEPVNFGYNPQTAESNSFQRTGDMPLSEITEMAKLEFSEMVNVLRNEGVTVDVFADTPEPIKPDAVFPNNWISLHADGRIIQYPMTAENRRYERRDDIVEKLQEKYEVHEVVDFSDYESEEKFLEGTGSIVFDHENKFAFAALSPRTDEEIFRQVCSVIGYKPVVFHAVDENSKPIYHTNVLMCIGSGIAVICLDSLVVQSEKMMVESILKETGHEILPISFAQMNAFAGNMLMLTGRGGNALMIMSSSAFNALSEQERVTISKYAKIVPVDIKTIETAGGGSARCMIAENFLPG